MKIGEIDIEKPLLLAPMEDITETSFRLFCKRMQADIVYTEFTSSEALIRQIPKAIKKITLSQEEHPIAIQIFGSKEESMSRASQIAEHFSPDFIDINSGCWIKNLATRGDGAGLLRDLIHFEKIVKSIVKSTHLPVTVKTRLGWDKSNIVITEIAKMVEQAGAQALAIHCRTRCQGYKGQAEWEWLEKVKKVMSIPLIGNGDVTTPLHVKTLFDMGCDGVMIGRAAITNPWIFSQSKHYLKTGECLPYPTLNERIQLCLEHLNLSLEHKGPHYGIITFRKHYMGYLKDIPHVATLRSDIMQAVDINYIRDKLYSFLHEYSQNPLASPPHTQ